jgi:hypothetical protein
MLMPTIPGSFAELLGAFRACFTAPTFTTFTALCAGLLAQPGPGTVTGMLAGARLAGIWHHAKAHRFFTHARWRPDHLGLLLCDLIVGRLLEADQPILLAVDDTLLRRASRRLPLAAFHHDPTAPAGRRIGWGHCWVVIGVVVRLPFVPHRHLALPVLARLWHPRDTAHTKLVLAHQLIRLLAARYPTRTIHVVADAAYAGHSPLGLPRRVTLTSRLRRDAALHALPAARQPGQRGRPRRKGDRLPTLGRLADHPATTWQPATVRRYGKQATVTLTAITCLWYHVHRTRPVQVVLVREADHQRGFDLALVSTDLAATPGRAGRTVRGQVGNRGHVLGSKTPGRGRPGPQPPPPRRGAHRAVRALLLQPAGVLVHPQRACRWRRRHPPRAGPLVPSQAHPVHARPAGGVPPRDAGRISPHSPSSAHRHETHRRAADLGRRRRMNTRQCETRVAG